MYDPMYDPDEITVPESDWLETEGVPIAELLEKRWKDRSSVIDRLRSLDVVPYYFPQMSTQKPAKDEKNLPILITEPSKLKQKRHVIVILNTRESNLGIWSHTPKRLQPNMSASDWSVIGMAEELQNLGDRAPGLVITNIGELFWLEYNNRGISGTEFLQMGHEDQVKMLPLIDAFFAPGPHNYADTHFSSVMTWVLNGENVHQAADISIVAVGQSNVLHLANCLFSPVSYEEYWQIPLKPRFNAIAWAGWLPKEPILPRPNYAEISNFFKQRSKAWLESNVDSIMYGTSDHPAIHDIETERKDSGFPSEYEKNHFIMPLAQKEILQFLVDKFEAGGGGMH